jgi:hypothetical protein
MSGLTALVVGIYQMQSGLKLYTMRFQVTSMVNYYWMYVGIFGVSLIAMKLYVIWEEDKVRRVSCRLRQQRNLVRMMINRMQRQWAKAIS